MFAQIVGRVAVSGRRPNALLKNRSGRLTLLLCTALLVQGCRTDPPPSPSTGRNPSDPRAPVARSTYQSTLGAYSSQRPVEPTPWREQNQGVARAPKQ